jgi:hypothetical protein
VRPVVRHRFQFFLSCYGGSVREGESGGGTVPFNSFSVATSAVDRVQARKVRQRDAFQFFLSCYKWSPTYGWMDIELVRFQFFLSCYLFSTSPCNVSDTALAALLLSILSQLLL